MVSSIFLTITLFYYFREPSAYYSHYDLASSTSTSAAPTSSSSYAELDLSIHSTTVKCEPDTTNKDTKVNEPPRSPYLDYHHNHHPFTSYNDNNNDLQAKMDSLHHQYTNHYAWNQYSSETYLPSSGTIEDIRYKVCTYFSFTSRYLSISSGFT